MKEYVEIEFVDIEEDNEIVKLINTVAEACFEIEDMQSLNMYLNIILTDENYIREANKKYRNIDKETDVLSFPMFEKDELVNIEVNAREVLGDIIISIPRVKLQAEEYGHSFERELAYMVVHGFYHIIGYDHIKEEDKKEMREKEEKVLNKLNIKRN